ncbi:aldehyde dehydrogenase family protein [Streptomyces sp. NPDC050617]|uniref:aldehyde dehydrogenase family protein n=1 Tax=Streptomyces sp. NPDC050617 TaxID=3154628 RepID=UPI00343B58C9
MPDPSENTFGVINPATGEVFATAPACSPEQLDAAMNTAHRAFAGSWSRDEEVRRATLRAAADALLAEKDRVAAVLTAEQGKPLAEAASEVDGSVRWLRYYADLEIEPEYIPAPGADRRVEVTRRPLGVVAAITPWNYPLLLAMWKIAPALRAGNTMVLKPSPFTPLATLAMGEVLQEVFPVGVFTVVTGPDPLGNLLTGHPLARKVSFTGSTATGKKVAAAAADDLKRITLELGGNDPAIILPDADPEAIAEQLFWSAFRNNGQICVAVKRVYAHESIQPRLVDALAEIARSIQPDDGSKPGARLGAINNEPQLHRVEELVGDAIARGAKAAAGGSRIDRPGYFFSPTILTDVPAAARIVSEEQFGPALPVLPYRNIDDAVAMANDSEYGLTSSVWGTDVEQATVIARRLDAGQAAVNAHAVGLRPDLPFAGAKWSGLGVENGPWGLHELTQLGVVTAPAAT